MSELKNGLHRIAIKNIQFSNTELNLIEAKIVELSNKSLDQISLLHCDLHTNNALYIDTPEPEVYLFDTGSNLISGHPIYDLALIYIEFPHLFGLQAGSDRDIDLYKYFIDGYGINFWEINNQLCREYVLLRAINRVGTTFTPYLPDLVRSILN